MPPQARGDRHTQCVYYFLAWISTGPDLPNMVLGQTAHFRALSLRNYYAKWCADSPIAQRLLAQRSSDSGQFRSLVNRLAFRMLGNSPSVEIQAIALGKAREGGI